MRFLLQIFFLFILAFNLFPQNNDSLALIEEKKSLAKINPYDESRDPAKDLEYAVSQAQISNKRILLQLGGNWCIWCKRLEKFIMENPDIYKELHQNYFLIKVNYSKENKNEAFLSNYPKIPGYPHIFVLEKDGSLLHSQDTSELEQDKGYGKNKILDFLNKWKLEKPDKE